MAALEVGRLARQLEHRGLNGASIQPSILDGFSWLPEQISSSCSLLLADGWSDSRAAAHCPHNAIRRRLLPRDRETSCIESADRIDRSAVGPSRENSSRIDAGLQMHSWATCPSRLAALRRRSA